MHSSLIGKIVGEYLIEKSSTFRFRLSSILKEMFEEKKKDPINTPERIYVCIKFPCTVYLSMISIWTKRLSIFNIFVFISMSEWMNYYQTRFFLSLTWQT